MGRIIEANFQDILPGEDSLDEKTLAGVIKFAESHQLLPPPVREIDGKYLHLEGRHSLIYNHLIGNEKVPLFLLDDSSDGMHNHNFPNVDTYLLVKQNDMISQRWFSAENIFRKLGVQNYEEHFKNLQKQHNFLTDLDTCKQYLQQKELF